MSFHLSRYALFLQREQLVPDRLPTFAPVLFESLLVLFLLGLLLGWTAIASIALALLAVGILRPRSALPVSILALVPIWGLHLPAGEETFSWVNGIGLLGIALLGIGLGKFLRQVEWHLVEESILLQLANTPTTATPEKIIEQTLSLLRDLADADIAIALRQVDRVTAEALVCLPSTAIPDKLTSPQIFAEALENNHCLYYRDYRAQPGAIRPLLSLGTRSLAVLPLQTAIAQGSGGVSGAVLLIWNRPIHISPPLKRCLESLLGELRTLLQFQQTTFRLETVSSRLGAILDTIPQGVIFVDDSGEHGWVNPRAAEHLGLHPGEVEPPEIAAAMTKLRLSAENQEVLCEQAAKFFSTASGEIRNWEWLFAQPQRKVISVSSTATHIRNISGRLWVLDDITDRYLLQQAVMQRSQELSHVNDELRDAALQQTLLYQQLASVNRELENLATQDGLTQIANRRSFDMVLQREWRGLMRSQSPLSLILIDVDFFKRYNDTYGHQSGDDCLKKNCSRAVFIREPRNGFSRSVWGRRICDRFTFNR